MSTGNKHVLWYDPTTREELKAKRAPAYRTGKDNASSGTQGTTDPDTVNFKTTVFNKVAKSFAALFGDQADRYERREDCPVGWTTGGQIGWLREEQDSQYQLIEELELKIEELTKEVGRQRELLGAYETKVAQNEEYLQFCMHWITMAQVFGDVPVAREHMKWNSGRVVLEEDEDGDQAMEEDAKETMASGSHAASQ